MKLIQPKAEYLPQAPGLEGVYKQVELAGRTCYKSTDKITEDSAKPFVDRMIASKHCYTGNSEVLTENGWIKWKDYQGQKIAVINPDLSFKGYEFPQRTVKYNYTGKFYEYPVLGLKVTEGHRMFGVFRLGSNDFYNNNRYDLFTCCGEFVDNNGRHKTNGERMFKTPKHCIKPTHTNPYMELVGFWLGDGCHLSSTKNKLVFHLKKKRKIEYLKELSRLLGWRFTAGKGNYYRIEYVGIGEKFNTLYYSNGNKKIDVGGYYSAEDIHSIITGLINSDGSYGINTKTITYTSTSESIINWICSYAPLAGYTISYKGICSQAKKNCKNAYKILFLTTDYTICNDSRYEDSKVLITEETEEVFCVTVSTGLILVRGTNGVTTICGNCAMLEHGTVYLYLEVNTENAFQKFDYPLAHFTAPYNWSDVVDSIRARYHSNQYSKVNVATEASATNEGYSRVMRKVYITANYRTIIENGWQDDLQFICEPTDFHEERYTFRLTTSIGVTREILRHRHLSFAEQSTRYCNFSKSKFNNEVTFCKPAWIEDEELSKIGPYKRIIRKKNASPTECWITSLLNAEEGYMGLLQMGWQPQQAREVLPLCTASEIVVTGFLSDFRHFFDLRIFGKTGNPHPNMRQLAELMMTEAGEAGFWKDIMSKPSKFD